MELILRFDYGHVVPWVRGCARPSWRWPGRTPSGSTPAAGARGEDLTTRASFAVSRATRSRSSSRGTRRTSTSRRRSTRRGGRRTRRVVARLDRRAATRSIRSCGARCSRSRRSPTRRPAGSSPPRPRRCPRSIGGVRNWDYRYCWVRDAALTLDALLGGGFVDEARAWRDWLLRAVAGDPRDMQIMYGCAGERRLTELELDWLPGYEGSRPVRIGNAAVGAVPARRLRRGDGRAAQRAASTASSPTSTRGASSARSSTSSRAPGTAGRGDLGGARPAPALRALQGDGVGGVRSCGAGGRAVRPLRRRGPLPARCARRSIARCARRAGTASAARSRSPTARRRSTPRLLLIPRGGFLPRRRPARGRHGRGRSQRELVQDGFVLRYPTDEADDGLPPGEGAFLPCSFWLADALALVRPSRRGARAVRPPGRARQRRRPVRRGVRPAAPAGWSATSRRRSRTWRT